MQHPSHRTARLCLIALVLLSTHVSLSAAETPAESTPAEIWALELGVPDVTSATDFYAAALGFTVLSSEPAISSETAGTWALLGNGSARLALALSSLPNAPAGSARAYPNFTVGDLETTSAAVVAAGGAIDGEPFETPVGSAVRIFDPFGNPAHLIDHPWDEASADTPPAIFNFGLTVHDMAAAEMFYTALGFTVRTRDYLPQTLVFEPQGVAQLILHPGSEPVASETRSGALLLDAHPGAALSALTSLEPRVERTTAMNGGAIVELRDPSGNLLKLARRTDSGEPVTRTAALSAEQAADAFERLKTLAGDWQAKSTRGWDEPVRYDLVAGGSVVVESNSFKDAPDNTMYTMFHMDEGRLIATHYCASGTQPRLLATGTGDDGLRLTFTYLDGTSLPSREHGHMDQAVFRFVDDDHFTAKWTWYEKGQERWMEEIEHRRVPARQLAAAR